MCCGRRGVYYSADDTGGFVETREVFGLTPVKNREKTPPQKSCLIDQQTMDGCKLQQSSLQIKAAGQNNWKQEDQFA